MILAIRTDQTQASLAIIENGHIIAEQTWQADRQLAETIHKQLDSLYEQAHQNPDKITGIVVYEGPGSFTGLRIGISVANALAYSYGVPIVGTTGDDWIVEGTQKLKTKPKQVVSPEYGAPVHTTTPRK